MNDDRAPGNLHVLPPSESFRLTYLAWYVVTSGDAAGDAWRARNGRARMIKLRVPGAPLPDTGWAIVPVGNCLACSYHDAGIPGACRNRRISPAAYARALGESDCQGFETGAFLPSPLGSRRIAGNRMLVAELRTGMHPVVRDQWGTRDVAMPDLPMVILQDLPFTAWGYYLVTQQQLRYTDLARDIDSGFDPEYDLGSDLGDVDVRPPDADEYRMIEPQVAYFLANPARIPDRAWV